MLERLLHSFLFLVAFADFFLFNYFLPLLFMRFFSVLKKYFFDILFVAILNPQVMLLSSQHSRHYCVCCCCRRWIFFQCSLFIGFLSPLLLLRDLVFIFAFGSSVLTVPFIAIFCCCSYCCCCFLSYLLLLLLLVLLFVLLLFFVEEIAFIVTGFTTVDVRSSFLIYSPE